MRAFILSEIRSYLCILGTCYTLTVLILLGFFMEPTIFTNVEDHMFIAQEESFGPVMIISIFENG